MLGARTCARCGRRNPIGSRFCNSCGELLNAPRRQTGCLGRFATTALIFVAGAVLLYLLLPSGCGLSIGNLLPLIELLSGEQAAPETPLVGDDALPDLAPGLRAVSYTVTAAAGAAPTGVVVDYVDSAARPVHAEVTLPWQHEAQLAPGVVARLVAEADAGQAFTARIYVNGELRAETEAEPVAADQGPATVWRAQCETLLGP